MNLIIKLINRVFNRIERAYFKWVFCGITGNTGSGLRIRGRVYLENHDVIVGRNVDIYPGVTFAGNGRIRLGDNCKLGQNTIIYANANGGVSIGDNTIIAAQNYIIDSNHNTDSRSIIASQGLSSAAIFIGDDVWLGANVTVLKGSIINDGVVVGAKSLVNSTIEKNAIVVGIPAEKVGTRINNG